MPRAGLSKRQRDVYNYVVAYREKRGDGPTMFAVAEALHVPATSVPNDLKRLKLLGFVTWVTGDYATLRPLRPLPPAASPEVEAPSTEPAGEEEEPDDDEPECEDRVSSSDSDEDEDEEDDEPEDLSTEPRITPRDHAIAARLFGAKPRTRTKDVAEEPVPRAPRRPASTSLVTTTPVAIEPVVPPPPPSGVRTRSVRPEAIESLRDLRRELVDELDQIDKTIELLTA